MNEISKISVNGSSYSILDDELKDKNIAVIEDGDSSATVAGFDPQSDTLWKSAQVLSSSEKTQVKDNLGLTQELQFINDKLDEFGVGWVTTSYIVDQREVDGNPKLPEDMITHHKPSMFATDKVYIDGNVEYRDVFARIRSHSHLYIGRYDTTSNTLKARQVSDTDKTKWVDGTPIVWGDEDDLFMKLPRFWWKSEPLEEDLTKITACMTQDYVDNTWHEWEGDTFIAVYEGTIINDKLYSKSGVTPTVNQSWTTFTADARARYSNNNYRLVTYEAHQIMVLLGLGWLGNTDSQSIIGKGTGSYPKTTGLCNSKGMTDSSASGDGNSTSINFWGLENWWGDISEWVDNVKTKDSAVTVSILGDDRTTEVRTVSCPNVSQNNYSNRCATKLQFGTNGDVLAKKIIDDGNYNKGFCDYGRVSSTAGYVARRSSYAANLSGGLACFDVNYGAGYVFAHVGSRLLYKGDYEIVDSFE